MTIAEDSTSYPTLATIGKFDIPNEHHGLMYEWAHRMKKRFDGSDTSPVCTDPEDPFAKRLVEAFGENGPHTRFSEIRNHLVNLQRRAAREGGWLHADPYADAEEPGIQCSRR